MRNSFITKWTQLSHGFWVEAQNNRVKIHLQADNNRNSGMYNVEQQRKKWYDWNSNLKRENGIKGYFVVHKHWNVVVGSRIVQLVKTTHKKNKTYSCECTWFHRNRNNHSQKSRSVHIHTTHQIAREIERKVLVIRFQRRECARFYRRTRISIWITR